MDKRNDCVQFWTEFPNTNIFQFVMNNSTNAEAIAWITFECVEQKTSDYTTFHDYWNAMIDEVQPALSEAIISEMQQIAADAEVFFTFTSEAKVEYL